MLDTLLTFYALLEFELNELIRSIVHKDEFHRLYNIQPLNGFRFHHNKPTILAHAPKMSEKNWLDQNYFQLFVQRHVIVLSTQLMQSFSSNPKLHLGLEKDVLSNHDSFYKFQ